MNTDTCSYCEGSWRDLERYAEKLEDLLADLANAVALDAPDAKEAARRAQNFLHTGEPTP